MYLGWEQIHGSMQKKKKYVINDSLGVLLTCNFCSFIQYFFSLLLVAFIRIVRGIAYRTLKSLKANFK